MVLNTIKILFPFIYKYKWLLFIGFFFLILQNYTLSKIPHYIKKALDEVTEDNLREVLIENLLIAIALTMVACLAMFLMRKYIISVSRHIEYELRDLLFKKLMGIDYRFYLENKTGDLISRCTNDLNDVRTLLGPGIMYIPNSLIRFAFFSPILFSISSKLMIWIVSVLAGLIVFIMVVMPKLRPLYKKIQEKIGEVNNRAWQVISGMYTIKLYHREEIEKKRFEELNQTYIDAQMGLVKWRGFLWPFFLYIIALTQFMILIIGGQEVISGQITLGELLQFTIMVSALQFPVLSFGWVMSLLQQGISAINRLNCIFNRPDEPTGDLAIESEKGIHYAFNNLKFSYPKHDGFSLNIPSLTFQPGEIIGITGPVGSGKSTLINLLTGILKPKAAQLFVNGHDINKVNIHSLRRLLAIVPQDNFLFSKSIRDNIALGQTPQDDRLIKYASEVAELKQDIKEMPNNLSEILGERGITLSGGQKQRVAIARAIFKNKNFMVLDDSLSNVDALVEDKILNNLSQLKNDKTIIMISNRISALKNADKILVIQAGQITQTGAHNQLIQNESGYYHKLYQLQKMEKDLN